MLGGVVVLAGDDDLRQTLAVLHLQGDAAASLVRLLGAQKGRGAGGQGHVGDGGDLLLESVAGGGLGLGLPAPFLGPPLLAFGLFLPPAGARRGRDVQVAVVQRRGGQRLGPVQPHGVIHGRLGRAVYPTLGGVGLALGRHSGGEEGSVVFWLIVDRRGAHGEGVLHDDEEEDLWKSGTGGRGA